MTLVEHRAAARIARRYALRAKARTALVLFLIALPISGLAGAGIMLKSILATPEDRATADLGSADARILGVPEPRRGAKPLGAADLRRAVPPGTTVVSQTSASAWRLAGGSLLTLEALESSIPLDEAPVAALYAVQRGRMPHVAGEAALPAKTAQKLGVKIDDALDVKELKLHLKIVGFAVIREAFRTDMLLVGPGTIRAPSFAAGTWLVDLPAGLSNQERGEALAKLSNQGWQFQTREETIFARQNDEKVLSTVSFGFAALGLFATGLIAAAALGVGARRQLRAIGLVGAGGGEPKHIKAIVAWGGTLQGLAGAAVGIVVAIVTAIIAAPHLDSVIGRIVGTVRVPWWAVAGGLVLGAVAATLASVGPARQAAGISTIDALAGRTPKPRAPGKLARYGAIAVAVGSGLTVLATISGEGNLLAIALVGTLSGFLLAIPLIVSWIGRSSRLLPGAIRLAARQTARYGRRTGAAVAAATLALAAPVSVAAITLSNEAHDNRLFTTIDRDQMTLSTFDPANNNEVPASIINAARAAIPGSTAAPLRYALWSQKVSSGPGQPESLSVQVSGPTVTYRLSDGTGGSTTETGELAIADANLLRAAHGERGIPYLNQDKIIAVGARTDGGVLHLLIPGGGVVSEGDRRNIRIYPAPPGSPAEPGEKRIDIPAVSVTTSSGVADRWSPEFSSLVPLYFMSPRAAARYGLFGGTATTALLRAPHVLSREEIARVKHAVAKIPGGYAQAHDDYVLDSTPARLLITTGAVVLALVIVAIAVALANAESRRERAILSAVGAGPFTRRRLAGANAFLMTAIAGVLAIPGGFLPVALIQMARRAGYPVMAPWSILAIVALGAPLVAGLFAAIWSREPKSHALLQPVW